MANEQVFDTVVDSAATHKQITGLVDDLVLLDKQVVDTAKSINILNSATANSKTFAELKKNADETEKIQKKQVDDLEKVRQAEKKLAAERDARLQKDIGNRQKQQAAQEKTDAKEAASLAKLRAQQKKAADDYEKEQTRMAAAKDKATKKEIDDDQKQLAIMARIARQREKDASAFKQLIADRDQARDKAQNIGATFGSNSDLFASAQKEFEGFQKQVDGINNKLGKFTDNVGNYAGKAFGLIRNIAYILPGIGIAGIFGLLSDGIIKFYQALASGETVRTTLNNLERKAGEIYAEQITKVNLLTEEARNQNTTSLRRQEIIEDLNKISPTYFGNLKNEQDIVSKLPDDYKQYNDAILANSRAKAAAAIIGDKYKEILGLQRDIIEGQDNANPDRAGGFAAFTELSFAIDQISEPGKEKRIKMLQEQINRLTKEYVTSSQKAGDVTGEQLAIQQRVTNESIEYNKQFLQNRININEDIAGNDAKSYGSRYKALKDSLSDQVQLLQYSAIQELNVTGLTADQEKAITDKNNFDILKANQDYQKKRRELSEKGLAQDYEITQKRLELQKNAAKQVVDSPDNDLAVKQKALQKYYQASYDLIFKGENEQLRLAGSNDKSRTLAKKNALRELGELDLDYANQEEKILKEAYDKQLNNAKQHDTDLLNELKTASELRIQEITKNAQSEIDALDTKQDSRIYEAKRLAIVRKSEDDILNERIKAAQNNIRLQTMSGLDASAEQKKLSDLEIQQFKNTEQRKTEYLKQEQSLRDQLKQAEVGLRIQAEQAVIDGVKSIVDASFEDQIAQAQKRVDLIDKESSAQKDSVERSLLSSKDKADKEKVIDALAAKDKEQAAAETSRIRQKEAEFNKEASALQVLVSTAEAVGKIELQAAILAANPLTLPLVPLALAQIPIAIAAGAIQEAAILATPIPKYAKGTKNYPGGLGIWGEAGMERATLPSGEQIFSGGTEIANFPKGTIITPHLELMKSIKPDAVKYTGGQEVPWREVLSELRKNRPTKQKGRIIINNNTDHNTIRKNYFK